ncbi:MAG: hypothetical protein JG781_2145 [Peptococcaceae bacterium]|jgi:hypothetical protein|uniref:Uncharacterized protein n=1 Tax=Thermanaerosceptrum fracticalcis TaxID=1712410 RepID=A0A7G6E7P2_THEFR|nr:hypothetical protein [Thermanaerosceptrum fracticalcis]MBZ4654788.1 hypothetical protein [Peptococcaceae bacterium]QNB48096.1 hypothetical protein BR63_18585 [Thermanaerosceptrum fracticalcis]
MFKGFFTGTVAQKKMARALADFNTLTQKREKGTHWKKEIVQEFLIPYGKTLA